MIFLTIIDSLLLKEGYTFLNTFIYSIIVVGVYFLLFSFFKNKIKIDIYFIRTIIPFLLIGSCLRIFEQENIINDSFVSFFIRVPGLLIFLFIFYMLFFLLFIKINKQKYNVYLEAFGYLLLFPLLLYLLINLKNYFSFFLIILITFFVCFILFIVFKKIFINDINKITLLAQTIDGVATTYGVIFYANLLKEVHVLSSLIISINPFLFLIIKIKITIFIIYFIDGCVANINLRTYIKTLLIIHGLLIGFRTLLTIGLL